MRLNSKGQVTIPADIRRKYGFLEGDEVDVVEDGDELKIVNRDADGKTYGQRVVARMRGSATAELGMTTDELMELLRGE